ncbi:uncharacterized protein ACA1_108580 [Acanthamoeba castellanii str. Neff]|uniref:Uncharacterized protein n=1 Tax=Acanthamoeba castellanii (strain ATCC 30010 / Neff) TaxID=1257118 RepID=L8GC49_ACACF|nr:uncharacterized protein ACA1_108580 [Acanthamoeba castellanii str. Neff]ELR10800.1 hypothetical protein ACA1_108580 [Acanthamoeba castellanii str. Neff]
MMSVSPVLCRLLLVLLFVGALHAQTRPDFLDFTSWMMVDASPSLSVLDVHYVPHGANEPLFLSLALDGEHRRSATLDHTKQLTDIVDSAESISVSFNRTVCTTECWRGSSCPRNPDKDCAVSTLPGR